MAYDDKLPALMQSVPQELFDKIYEDVFTADEGERIIDKRYNPPVQLQVDSSSREHFAKSYYGGSSTFMFPDGFENGWLEPIPQRHFDMLTYVRFMQPATERPYSMHEYSARARIEYLQYQAFASIARRHGRRVTFPAPYHLAHREEEGVQKAIWKELFTEIHDLVFAVSSGIRPIDKNRRLPFHPKIDSYSHDIYAATYYGDGSDFIRDRAVQLRWAASLDVQHFDQICCIQNPYISNNFLPGPLAGARTSKLWQIWLFEDLPKCLDDLRCKLLFPTKGGNRIVVWKMQLTALEVTFTEARRRSSGKKRECAGNRVI